MTHQLDTLAYLHWRYCEELYYRAPTRTQAAELGWYETCGFDLWIQEFLQQDGLALNLSVPMADIVAVRLGLMQCHATTTKLVRHFSGVPPHLSVWHFGTSIAPEKRYSFAVPRASVSDVRAKILAVQLQLYGAGLLHDAAVLILQGASRWEVAQECHDDLERTELQIFEILHPMLQELFPSWQPTRWR